MQHIRKVHPAKCDCVVCKGDLFVCDTCKGAEGQLTTECCGQPLTEKVLDRVFNGEIDFINNHWKIKNRLAGNREYLSSELPIRKKEHKCDIHCLLCLFCDILEFRCMKPSNETFGKYNRGIIKNA